MTSLSMLPYRRSSIRPFPKSDKAIIPRDISVVTNSSWSAARQAIFSSFIPRAWPATTAPPVAMAARSCISSRLMESTRETPDTAASPTSATITTSSIPTSTERNCSIISGTNSRIRSFLENMAFTPEHPCQLISSAPRSLHP